jgi:hypothetical protein
MYRNRRKEGSVRVRVKKLQLIVSQNPEKRDLAADWHKEPDPIFAKAKA